MKRTTALATLAALALTLPSIRARAQEDDDTPTPGPTPEPHTYNDDAMSLVVPPEFQLARRGAAVTPTNLADKPIVVAEWVCQKPHIFQIQLSMVAYDYDLAGFNTQYESQMREGIEGLMVHGTHHVTLKNGMPAMWIEMGFGSDFNLVRQYSLIWADTLRGIVLSYAGRLGEVDENVAKVALSNVSAVAYPKGRN